MKTLRKAYIALFFVIVTGMVISVPGCKEFNDNPVERAGNLIIDLNSLQRQLGINPSDAKNASITNVPGDTDATNPVKGLIVGVMLVTSRSTPYTSDVAMTEAIVENLTDELTNSQQFIVTLKLPTSQEYVEIRSPKKDPASGGLQIIAAAVDFAIEELAEVGESEHENSLIYIGFIERFYSVDDIGDSALDETLVMKRACLNNNTIKGCATYPDKLTEDPVVTPAVEILGVRYNDTAGVEITDYTSGNFYGYRNSAIFPMTVWTEIEASNAKTALKSAVLSISQKLLSSSGDPDFALTTDPITNLTIITTHSKNTSWELDACRTFWASSPSSSALDQMIWDATTDSKTCDVQAYKVPISGN